MKMFEKFAMKIDTFEFELVIAQESEANMIHCRSPK